MYDNWISCQRSRCRISLLGMETAISKKDSSNEDASEGRDEDKIAERN